jgi:2-oxoisovalerate dehydrogenase E2 component (dihydrolipoyl transacylase)
VATTITMPQLGESVTEGTIGRWLKSVGEAVAKDEPLVEIITDKVNVEFPSPAAGVLTRIAADEGQTVPVGHVIAELDGEEVAEPPEREASNREPVAVAAAGARAPVTAQEPSEGVARTSPLVRRLAKEHGIDLRQVKGSGLGGRVTKDDIVAYIEKSGARAAEVPAAVAAQVVGPTPTVPPSRPRPTSTPSPVGWQPLSPRRRAIAEHMVRAVSTQPHVTLCVEIDVTGVARARQAAQAEFQRREGFELTYLPFFAKAVIEALREHPMLNAAFQLGERGDPGVVVHQEINLGIAVGLDDGLIVPVVHDADALSVAGLARAVRELVTRAREGKLSPDDVRGGTFTLNNTGALGSIKSNSIINAGQAAIITMEAVVRRPVVVTNEGEETIAIRSMMNSCLTFDHRVLDGLPAGRFMQSVKRYVEGFGPGMAIY